jgi:IS30 family transposase
VIQSQHGVVPLATPQSRLQQLSVREASKGRISHKRGRIVQVYEDDRTLNDIANQFQRAPSTISRTVHGASTHNQGSELARTGRPRSYTPRDQCRVLLTVERHEL